MTPAKDETHLNYSQTRISYTQETEAVTPST